MIELLTFLGFLGFFALLFWTTYEAGYHEGWYDCASNKPPRRWQRRWWHRGARS